MIDRGLLRTGPTSWPVSAPSDIQTLGKTWQAVSGQRGGREGALFRELRSTRFLSTACFHRLMLTPRTLGSATTAAVHKPQVTLPMLGGLHLALICCIQNLYNPPPHPLPPSALAPLQASMTGTAPSLPGTTRTLCMTTTTRATVMQPATSLRWVGGGVGGRPRERNGSTYPVGGHVRTPPAAHLES
jgi:hypothetical protein